MNRVAIEYGKALVMALCGVTVLVVCVVGRTVEGAGGVIAFGAFAWSFVLEARISRRARAGGCGQRPQSPGTA